MSNSVFKMTKLVGESPDGVEAAVQEALATSAQHVRGQTWAHITDLRANLGDGGQIDRWQVTVEVAFEVDD
jgi:flavin-binding protein dodecin